MFLCLAMQLVCLSAMAPCEFPVALTSTWKKNMEIKLIRVNIIIVGLSDSYTL